jgi:hypothetical protein
MVVSMVVLGWPQAAAIGQSSIQLGDAQHNIGKGIKIARAARPEAIRPATTEGIG